MAKPSPAHMEALFKTQSSWMRLQSACNEIQAAQLINDFDEIERLRIRAHDILEAHISDNIGIADAVRATARGD